MPARRLRQHLLHAFAFVLSCITGRVVCAQLNVEESAPSAVQVAPNVNVLQQSPSPTDVDSSWTVMDPASASVGQTAALSTPTLLEPYWVGQVQALCRSENGAFVPIVYDQAIWDALAHSPFVKAVRLVPQISYAKINEASGQFDPTPFVDSMFTDSSDPVGNTLTTGGPSRLNEYRSDNGIGLRAKNQFGGSSELTQNMQLRNNNSVFLSPAEQADAKILMKLNQPLMKGAGRAYATSSIRIAEFNAGVSQYEATRKLQLHAQSIASAYWNLYVARAIELQAERGKQRLIYLRDEIAKRTDVDGLKSQLMRAEAALARQTSGEIRAQADVISATATLRALVNSPQLACSDMNLMPATQPIDEPFIIDRMSELQSALACHPDLLATRERIKAAAIRLKVAENDLRPTLNLVMEGYLHGLNGNYGMGDSLVDQFSQGRPSYSGGLNYQRPYRNVIYKAIQRQRRMEMQQLLYELDNTMLTVTAEVDQAIAAVMYTFAELEAASKSTTSFAEEVSYLEGRWRNAFVEATGPGLLLDELLNAQNQLIQSENSWARAQAEHMIAFAKLHVATGSLLNWLPLPACD